MGKDRLNQIMAEDTGTTGATGTPERPIKTVYLSWPLHDRLERLVKEWGVDNESALIRWLLGLGLEAVDKGAKPRTVTKPDFD